MLSKTLPVKESKKKKEKKDLENIYCFKKISDSVFQRKAIHFLKKKSAIQASAGNTGS